MWEFLPFSEWQGENCFGVVGKGMEILLFGSEKEVFVLGIGFRKFKSKMLRYAVIKSVLYGASLGFFAVGGLVFLTKFSTLNLDLLWCILIGAGFALISGAVFFLIQRPSDEKVARRLDSVLSFGEKTRTMVAFRGEDGDMLEIQRTDADEKLAGIPTKKLKVRDTWASVGAFVLSLALCVTVLLIPVVAEVPEDPIVDEYNQNWRAVRVQQLIDQVKKSMMEESVRSATVEELESLLETVRSTDRDNVMKNAAIETIVGVDGIVKKSTTSVEISSAMANVDTENMKAIATALESMSGTAFRKQMRTVRTAMQSGNVEEQISALTEELDVSLRNSGIPAEDPLCATLRAFVHALSDIGDRSSEIGKAQVQEMLDLAFDTVVDTVSELLLKQRSNRSMGDTVILELMDIFSISAEDLKTESDVPVSVNPGGSYTPPDSEDEDPNLSEGGFGHGGILYGSEDTIYDPELDDYVTYGEVIDRYFAKILALKTDGRLTEDMAIAFDEYFAFLYNSSKQ